MQSIEGFLAYVRPHWRRLNAAARLYAANSADAQDLVQETLLRAWRSYSPSDDRSFRRAWLFIIQRNVAFEWSRAPGRRIQFLPDDALTELAAVDLAEPFAGFAPMSDEQFCELLDDRILAALNALPPDFREVVVLSVHSDLTYAEIAEVCDCPVGTVMSRMARARRSLRERLAEFAPRVNSMREQES